MKRIFLAFLLSCSVLAVSAQIPGTPLPGYPSTPSVPDTGGVRYRDPIFADALLIEGIPFGMGDVVVDTITSTSVIKQPLQMDVYQPLGDLQTKRPVIVWAFGGAFVFGARVSPDIVELCRRYARLGYVCVSIDYRLSDELLVNPNAANATRAVLKGTHDMKAAVRYLYKSVKDMQNLFGIDTNQIYVGGVSAGAFCALHTAYLDKVSEVPEVLLPELQRTGGIEGNSGNPGYSSKVAGVINLCGALGKATWLEQGNVPIVSMHGTADDVVPYDSDTVTILGINYPVDGSAAITRRANEVGVRNAFYTWYGAGHTPFVADPAYMDTTYQFTRDFMYGVVSDYYATASVKEKISSADLNAYPNPSNGLLHLNWKKGNNELNIKIADLTGKTVLAQTLSNTGQADLDATALPAGFYILSMENAQQGSSIKLAITR